MKVIIAIELVSNVGYQNCGSTEEKNGRRSSDQMTFYAFITLSDGLRKYCGMLQKRFLCVTGNDLKLLQLIYNFDTRHSDRITAVSNYHDSVCFNVYDFRR